MRLVDYIVMFRGKPLYPLNHRLAEKQGLTALDVDTLKALHVEMAELFEKIEKETSKKKLKLLAKEIQELEFAMQRGWKFEEDARFHNWWYKAPKCACPKLDNQERQGTGQAVINSKCPLHGK